MEGGVESAHESDYRHLDDDCRHKNEPAVALKGTTGRQQNLAPGGL